MNRRDILKALAALPVTSAWAGCSHEEPAPTPATSSAPVHTLQILLEGAFAVVLQRTTRRLIAFVPTPDPARTDLAHQFYYNDPESRQRPNNYQFELAQDGLRTSPTPFINTDFNDFKAETDVWNHPPSLVSLDLPFPRSINFSGRPLDVRFAQKKRPGKMPTNYIIEYFVDDADKVKMMCEQMGGRTPQSPNCPPGIMRYYFGVGPVQTDHEARRKHAVAFFNFMLARSFPHLRDKYTLDKIEPADDEIQRPDYKKDTAFDQAEAPALAPAVLQSTAQRPRLLRVLALVDCDIGGILVGTNKPASGH